MQWLLKYSDLHFVYFIWCCHLGYLILIKLDKYSTQEKINKERKNTKSKGKRAIEMSKDFNLKSNILWFRKCILQI